MSALLAAAGSDVEDAAKFRWLRDRVVVLDQSTPNTMIITVMFEADSNNGFLDAAIDEGQKATSLK